MTHFARVLVLICSLELSGCAEDLLSQPNILFIVTDDQSWIHTSFYGEPGVETPNFDRIASSGVYFESAYVSAPSCTASRSAILAGQNFWQLGSAATLWGEFDSDSLSYQHLLENAGYRIAYTGKGWGPGRVTAEEPVGTGFNVVKNSETDTNSEIDYAASFSEFLNKTPPNKPFSFWFSPTEPHRPFKNRGIEFNDVELSVIKVPEFLPDSPEIRRDLANYYAEIKYQDQELGKILDELEARGLMASTLIVATSDNGMPFPRAKSTNYEYGTRVPLAIRWDGRITPKVEANLVVSLTDLAPTFLSAAGVDIPPLMTGRNLLPALLSTISVESENQETTIDFSYALSGFERHIVNAREGNQTYPRRAIHTKDYSYIENFTPQRWPAGDPPLFRDIDNGSPSKTNLLSRESELRNYATKKNPRVELYNIQTDPYQLTNLASNPNFVELSQQLSEKLYTELENTQDPLLLFGVDAFADMPYYGPVQDN